MQVIKKIILTMSSVRNISISHALSYFDDDIKKKEAKGFDYYSQEDSGVWIGKTAERLGLTEKPFTREIYHDMMNGKFSFTVTKSNMDIAQASVQANKKTADGKTVKTGDIVNIDMDKHSGKGKHQPGIELTLSAPKSLSVMSEVFKDKRVLDCNIKAVNTVLDYIQDNFVYTRSSIDGVMKLEKVDNLIAVKFTHHTSRDHDPQLHTHNLILNIIIDKNGKIKTAEFGMVFENERFIRELYNGELAHNLQEIGYEINWTKKIVQIAPEIQGVPQELTNIFSTGRQRVEKYIKEHDMDINNPEHTNIANLATRPKKDNSLGIDELSITWDDKMKELEINSDKFKAEMYQKNAENISKNNINKLNIDFTKSADFIVTKNNKSFNIGGDLKDLNNVNKLNNLDTLNTLNNVNNLNQLNTLKKPNKHVSLSKTVNDSMLHLTERKATFSKEELISNVISRSNGHYGVKAIEEEISKNRELVNSSLEIQEYAKHLQKFNERERTVFTTKTQIETEKTIISNVNGGKSKFTSICNNTEIENLRNNGNINNSNKIINRARESLSELNDLLFEDIENKPTQKNNTYSTLNDNQKHTVEFILKSKDQFIGIQGYAGVGKTYAIKALNEQLKEKGYNLIGLAPTNSATETLSKEAGIKTETLQSFLLKYSGYANDRNGNIIVLNNVRESFRNKMILVDESSLISNKQMKDLTTIANKLNIRVLLQGDEKQLDSVEAGTPFQRLIKDKVINYSELDNILRQKNETIKQAVYDIINKDVIKAFDKLKETDSIIELRTNSQLDPELNKDNYFKDSNLDGIKKDLVSAVVNKYFSCAKEDRSKTLIITSSNEIRKSLNNEIRNNIKLENEQNKIDKNDKSKSVVIETLEIKSLTNQEKKEISSYDVGNSVVFTKANTKTGIKKNVEYKILQVYGEKEINIENKEKQVVEEYKAVSEIKVPLKQNEILVSDGNKTIIVNVVKHANNLNIYEKIDKELIINDQIKWTNTDKEKGIFKGDNLIVRDVIKKEDKTNERNENISKEQTTIILFNSKTEKEIILNLNNNEDKNILKHIDYNYVSTTYSAQGKTSKNVIYTLESYRPNLTTQKEVYVGLSRTKDNATLITDNVNNSIQALIKNSGEKLCAIDVNKNIVNKAVNNLSNTLDKNAVVDNSVNSIKNTNIDKLRNIELEFD